MRIDEADRWCRYIHTNVRALPGEVGTASVSPVCARSPTDATSPLFQQWMAAGRPRDPAHLTEALKKGLELMMPRPLVRRKLLPYLDAVTEGPPVRTLASFLSALALSTN